MFKSRLVPRGMATLGLIGGTLIILSGIGVLFDVFDAGGTVQALATIPEFIWELSLGIYCAVRGSSGTPRSSPGLRRSPQEHGVGPVERLAPQARLGYRRCLSGAGGVSYFGRAACQPSTPSHLTMPALSPTYV